MATFDSSTNASNLARYYERKLLSTLEPRLVLAPLGKQQKIPKGEGKLVRWLRYAKHNPSTNPLSEGVNPAATSLTTSQVEAIVDQYGEYVTVSDFINFTALDPVMKNISERLGRGAADLVEQLHVTELDAEAFEFWAGDATGVGDIAQADVLNHQEIIQASVDQELAFIGPHESGKRVAVLNTAAKFDIMADNSAGSWVDINKFTDGPQSKILNGQFGEMYGARLVTSDRMSALAAQGPGNDVTVRNNYLIGEEGYGNVSFASKQIIEMIMKGEDSGGVSNPLNMYSTVGYKLKAYKVKYLDSGSKRVINIRAASAQDA